MKKLICILFVMMLVMTGCGKNTPVEEVTVEAEETTVEAEEVTVEEVYDPGPPHICEIGGIDEFLEIKEIAEKPEEEQDLFLEEKGYAGNLISASDIDDIIALVERAPIPLIEGYAVTGIDVYPDDTWKVVDYNLGNGMEFSYFLRKAEERHLKTEDIRIEFVEERVYGRNDVSFFRVEIDGIPVEITTPKMDAEEAEKLFETVRFLRAEDLQTRNEAEKVPLVRQEPDITAKAWNDYEEVIENKVGKKALVPVYREESLFFDTNGLFYLNRDACFYEDQNIRQNASGALLTQFPTDAIVKRDDGWVYLIYETDTGCRLYLLISPENGYEKTAGFPIVIKNRLSMEDFADLEKGDPIELVEKIDPVAALHKKQILEDWDLSPKAAATLAGYGHPCTSIHYLNDGILKIEYEMKQDQSLVISAIEHSADYTLVDATGVMVSYRINEEDLPEDTRGA